MIELFEARHPRVGPPPSAAVVGWQLRMARMLTKDEISKLAVEESLVLISELWDSLSPAEVPLPESHRRALDGALEEYKRDPDAGQPWEGVRD